MGARATGFWLVLAAVLAAGILFLTADLLWLAYPDAHVTVVVVAALVVLISVAAVAFFARAWFRWAFGAARERGESFARALLNVFRLALATRVGRAVLGGFAIGIAIVASPSLLLMVGRHDITGAIIFGLLLVFAIALNGLAISSAGWAVQAATATNLAKWERVFAVEDEVGPIIDFNRQTEVRLRIKPVRGNHWMFGLKFSRSDEFSSDRYSSGYPLWHLGKGQDTNDLVFTYYDELSRGRGALLCAGYRDEAVAIVIKRTGSQLVLSVDCNPDWSLSLDARSHRFAQPTAWAEGRPFQIKAELEVLSTQSIPQPSADLPKLRMDDTLAMDTATRHHAVYFRLRFWNDGGGAITPEVRVTRVLISDEAREARFSPQLPLLLGWSSLAAPPALTRQHTGGETVGVLGALNWVDRLDIPGTGAPIEPPLLYVVGEQHQPEIGQTDEKVFVKVQALVPGERQAIERWFWVRIEKNEKGYYATTGHVEEAPQPAGL